MMKFLIKKGAMNKVTTTFLLQQHILHIMFSMYRERPSSFANMHQRAPAQPAFRHSALPCCQNIIQVYM